MRSWAQVLRFSMLAGLWSHAAAAGAVSVAGCLRLVSVRDWSGSTAGVIPKGVWLARASTPALSFWCVAGSWFRFSVDFNFDDSEKVVEISTGGPLRRVWICDTICPPSEM
jgi:hypothetical protein